MTQKFESRQMYAIEQTVQDVASELAEAGWDVGQYADEYHYDGKPAADLSPIMDRLLDARQQLESAIGLVRAYEIHRNAQEVTA
jgi:hypothetical protein